MEGSIRPTRAGQEVLEVARRVLKDIGNLAHRLTDNHELRSGDIVLGTGTTMFLYFLPKVLAAFRAAYPNVDVKISTGAAPEILTGIRESMFDMGIVFSEGMEQRSEDEIQFEPLYKEEFVLIVPPGHLLEKSLRPSTATLNGVPVIALSRNSTIRHMIKTRPAQPNFLCG